MQESQSEEYHITLRKKCFHCGEWSEGEHFNCPHCGEIRDEADWQRSVKELQGEVKDPDEGPLGIRVVVGILIFLGILGLLAILSVFVFPIFGLLG